MQSNRTSGGDLATFQEMKRSSSMGSLSVNDDLSIAHSGEEGTTDFRLQAVEATHGQKISLWHDISLVHVDPETRQETEYLNFVCEIPKFSRKKYEIATSEDGNPIKQDTKAGVLREFKKGDIYFNYGCFPQTWEDPTHYHPDANGTRGDNDPLDVCEIGARIINPGDIRPVKVLGILLMIDEGECDWKTIVIDADDKWAPHLNDIQDVQNELPGLLEAIREWYRTYKIPDGKPPNTFGLDEQFMGKGYAMSVIAECHDSWEHLMSGEKERLLDDYSDHVKDLVRNLSKNSLLLLGGDLEIHEEAHGQDFGQEESGAVFF